MLPSANRKTCYQILAEIFWNFFIDHVVVCVTEQHYVSNYFTRLWFVPIAPMLVSLRPTFSYIALLKQHFFQYVKIFFRSNNKKFFTMVQWLKMFHKTQTNTTNFEFWTRQMNVKTMLCNLRKWMKRHKCRWTRQSRQPRPIWQTKERYEWLF